VVNGQKIWTSNAQDADWMFALVRTEPDEPRHGGLSYLLIEMNTPGIDVRPAPSDDGGRRLQRGLPRERARAGEQHRRQARAGLGGSRSTLKHERALIGGAHLTRRTFDGLVMLAQGLERDGRPAIQDPVIRNRLVELEARLVAAEYHGHRLLTMSARGTEAGLASLVTKLYSTVLGYDIAKLANGRPRRSRAARPRRGERARHGHVRARVTCGRSAC